ncbi:hypothetical protein ACFO0M_21550 [Micromonospora mangrovi]|uniref:Uncharacterized protein n=2 Tax=Micromonospora TaxID=1873 RepID=A0AAU8HCT6_9ACTN
MGVVSRTCDIDLTFEELPPLSVIVDSLARSSCELSSGSLLSYMDNSNGLFEWKYGRLTDREQILEDLSRSLRAGNSVGFHVSWPDVERAGSVTILPEHKLLSFSPDAETSEASSGLVVPRIGWYWDALVDSLGSLGLTAMAARACP